MTSKEAILESFNHWSKHSNWGVFYDKKGYFQQFKEIAGKPEIIQLGKTLGEDYVKGNYDNSRKQLETIKLRPFFTNTFKASDIISWSACIPIRFPSQDERFIMERAGVVFRTDSVDRNILAKDGFLTCLILAHREKEKRVRGYQHPGFLSVYDPYALAALIECLDGDLGRLVNPVRSPIFGLDTWEYQYEPKRQEFKNSILRYFKDYSEDNNPFPTWMLGRNLYRYILFHREHKNFNRFFLNMLKPFDPRRDAFMIHPSIPRYFGALNDEIISSESITRRIKPELIYDVLGNPVS